MLKNSSNTLLFSYWNQLRKNRLAPSRHEIDPAKISRLLPNIFILEYDSFNNDYRFRLAGSAICDQFGKEMARISLFSHFNSPVDRHKLKTLLSGIRTRVQPGFVEFNGCTLQSFTARFEMIILPMNNDEQGINRFLGAIYPVEPAIWIGRLALRNQEITKIKLVHTDVPSLTAVKATDNENTPQVLPLKGRKERVVKHQHRVFRVIDGGKLKPRKPVPEEIY